MIIKIYTKPQCPLCDKIREMLHEAGIECEEINILENPILYMKYRNDIPVVQSNQRIWFYRDRNKIPLLGWLKARE